MKKAWVYLTPLMAALAGLLVYNWAWVNPDSPQLQTGYLFANPKPLSPFELTDQHGNTFDNSKLNGKWSLVFIGFTFCPDICPTTLSKLAAAFPELNRDNDMQVIFLSVDPARDSPDKLSQYIRFYHPDFIAVTGPHQNLLPLTRELGMVYSMVGEGDDYQVDHSASLVLISPKGEKYAVFKPTTDGKSAPQILNQQLIADMEIIREPY